MADLSIEQLKLSKSQLENWMTILSELCYVYRARLSKLLFLGLEKVLSNSFVELQLTLRLLLR